MDAYTPRMVTPFSPGLSRSSSECEAEHVESLTPASGSSMTDLHGAGNNNASSESLTRFPLQQRRSTLMLDDEDLGQLATSHRSHDEEHHEEGQLSRANSGEHVELSREASRVDCLVETVIEWKSGGNQVFVTGSFTGWRQMVPLHRFEDGTFGVVLKLAPGTHRLRFVVDGELRCSEHMQTATDSMGNLVNFMEVVDPGASEYTAYDENDVPNEPQEQYTSAIPAIFVDPGALDRISASEFTTPPQLPPHLEGVILNANWNDKDNNSVLPVPNHVVLNHMATTSIRHNVLAVASVSRYRTKFVTQILYTPL